MRRAIGGFAALLCALLFCAASAPARASAETFYVNSTADADTASADAATLAAQCEQVQAGDIGPSDGTTCTLRGALFAATENPGANTITFWKCGPYVVSAALPVVPANTTIDGGAALGGSNDPENSGCQEEYYQWYFDQDPTTYNAEDPGCPEAADDPWYPDCESANYGFAHIEGPGGNQTFPGLVLDGAGSSVIRMSIGGFTDGVTLGPPGNDTVAYDAIGNDSFERGPLNPQNTQNGVEVQAGSANDVIGYSAAADGTTNTQDDIYGNLGWGVYLDQGSGPTVIGNNFIGTDTSGDQYAQDGPQPTDDPPDGSPVPDGNGLGGVYDDGTGDLIGGSVPCKSGYDTCTSNVIAGNQGPGIEFGPDASKDKAASNFIGEALNFYGTNYDGVIVDNGALPNLRAGVLDRGNLDTIGGSGSANGNQVAGNTGPGIELEGTNALVESNLVGLNFAGAGADANHGAGIIASDAAGVTNGTNRIVANTIGGNTGPGVELDQGNDSVLSNQIGVAGDHTTPAPNAIGVLAKRGPEEIGAPTNSANVIAHNAGAGVAVVDPSDSTYVSNVHVYDNSIFANTGLGIDLGNDGPTANHIPDTAFGPNGWTNAPQITSASVVNGQWSVRGTITAAPNTYYTIYVYGNEACDSSGYGQGRTLVAGGAVTTDANGQAGFGMSGTGGLPSSLSATAAGGSGSSEFGPCATVGGGVSLSATQTVTGKVIAGDAVDVDIHVGNAGPSAATNVNMTLTVPSDVSIESQPAGCPAVTGDTFTCDLGTIAAGAGLDAHVLLLPKPGTTTMTDAVTFSADQVQTSNSESDLATAVTPNPATPVSVTNSAAEPTPSYEQFLRLDRVSGTVTAQLPNGQRINLSNYALIPSGTLVTATQGEVRVTSQLPNSKRTSFSNFRFGTFKVTQARGAGGLVTATMNQTLTGCSAAQLSTTSKVSRALSFRGYAAKKPAPSKKKPTTRKLWGHDKGGGSYQIRGNRGAATVNGTEWQVTDTCTSTTISVYRDSVKVTGIGNSVPKRATVKAGHHIVLTKG